MGAIKRMSLVGMVVLVPMLIYYPIREFGWLLELSFLDPFAWTRDDAWVDPTAQIAMGTRIAFFVVWMLPILIGWLAYLAAFSVLTLLWRGIVFDERIARRLQWMGWGTIASAVLMLVAGSLSPMIRSWHNADGPLPLRLWMDVDKLALGFSGLAFLFFGLVMQHAIRIARENEEFV
ncbi:DUF2975 domain-containing protein [Sulfitobacter albidus]|uniref:DUF2975 domain-containing protein n=1 Tax=Sulfitobacter albidus TaxID=2829501 RepID=A0A975JB06_9RHOB|nr:DUF2975 domain-containing protein [Sulfitobacter albidus]QUJ75128.1 DUF2975 domain-containing protein [Sulfitobacter albidus]